jgi:alkylhydroperoxidase/carboxymuconolactone decarboxylase family protein YurZ
MSKIQNYSEDANESGIQIRRELFGAARIDKQLQAKVDPFKEEFMQLLNHYCFTEIWMRPGLPRQSRSLITMSMLIALGKPQELRLHIGAALRNGVTRDEIKEVFLQATVYCGVPAGVEAFRCGSEVFAEIDTEVTT